MITACLVASVAMNLDGGMPLQTNAHFSAKEWTDIQKLTSDVDQIVLLDGTHVSGTIEKIPKLSYPFGTISFAPSDVVALVFLQDQGQTKMELVTQEGLHFKGEVSKDYFILSPDHEPQKVIFPYKVHWVVFKDQKRDPKKPKEKLYCLKLQNGDVLTVALGNHPISVTNEQGEMTLKSDVIESLYFDGKLHGTLSDATGEQKELPYSSVKEPVFVAKLGNTSRLIRLPWNEIDSLKVSQPIGENKEADFDLLTNRLPGVQINVQPSLQKVQHAEEKVAKTEPEKNEPPEIAFIFLGDDSKSKQRDDMLLEEDNGIGVNITAEAFDIDESKLEAGEAADSDIEFVSKSNQSTWKVSFPENYQPIAFNPVKSTTHTSFGDPLVRNLEINPDIQQPNYFENNDLEELAADPDIFDTFLSAEEFEEALTHTAEFSEFKSPATGKQVHSGVNVHVEKARPVEKEAMVFVSARIHQAPDYYIDRDRVTNKEYKKFMEATNYPAPSHWEDGEIPVGKEHEPVVNVSYKDALVYAVWVGKRLPSEAEWMRAARNHMLNLSEDDSIKEWTSTAYTRGFENQEKKLAVVHAKHHSARKYDIVRVCAGSPAAPLSADTCCPSTGFRCASHVHD